MVLEVQVCMRMDRLRERMRPVVMVVVRRMDPGDNPRRPWWALEVVAVVAVATTKIIPIIIHIIIRMPMPMRQGPKRDARIGIDMGWRQMPERQWDIIIR